MIKPTITSTSVVLHVGFKKLMKPVHPAHPVLGLSTRLATFSNVIYDHKRQDS
jgi:hypothetical protein